VAEDGDALDDVFYVLGVDKSKLYLQKHPGAEVFLFLPEADKNWKTVPLK